MASTGNPSAGMGHKAAGNETKKSKKRSRKESMAENPKVPTVKSKKRSRKESMDENPRENSTFSWMFADFCRSLS
jgi:hypothetical protein